MIMIALRILVEKYLRKHSFPKQNLAEHILQLPASQRSNEVALITFLAKI